MNLPFQAQPTDYAGHWSCREISPGRLALDDNHPLGAWDGDEGTENPSKGLGFRASGCRM